MKQYFVQIISNNYVTFENIQGLQKQNKTLLEIVRSLSKENDEQELQIISDLKVFKEILITFLVFN